MKTSDKLLLKTRPPFYVPIVTCYFFGGLTYIVFNLIWEYNLIITIVAIVVIVYLILLKFTVNAELKINSLKINYWLNIFKPRVVYDDIKLKEVKYKYAGNRSPPLLIISFIYQNKKMEKKILLSGLSDTDIEYVLESIREHGVPVIK